MAPIRDRTRLLLGFEVPVGTSLKITSSLRTRLSRLGLVLDGTGDSLSTVQHTWRHLWVRDARRRVISDARVVKIKDALRPGLGWVAPVHRDPRARSGAGLWATLPDVLLVAPRHGADQDLLTRALSAYGLREWAEKSRYLGRWRYFVIDDADWDSATRLAATILKQQARLIADVSFDLLAQTSPFQFEPNDIWYWQQWNLPQIGAPQAWDLAKGRGITVAVLDSGCDLAHPDLDFASPGINLDDMTRDGSPVEPEPWHGTRVAGIIGAGLNNIVGVAGLAGECRLLPIATTAFSAGAWAMGIRYALDHGARVLNISLAVADVLFEMRPLLEAIEDAVTGDPSLIICASSGNDSGAILATPARHPDVLACGASDHADARWQTGSRGSSYGDSIYLGRPSGIAVVAPGIEIRTTDMSGPGGPGPDGLYTYFNATSASTPHVSAVAALLLSHDATLNVSQIRRIIESTAEKTGPLPYADVDGYPNGTRNPQMGYGRLNAFRAVDFGDVMIADWPGDDGVEPSTPPDGVYWETSDLIVRPTSADDDPFDPTDPDTASVLVPGLDHTVFVRVKNVGPNDARNVHVEARVTPWVGTEFFYDTDWVNDDAMHLRPTPLMADFPTVPAGGPPVLAQFSLTAAQVDVAAGWGPRTWHPCLLGVVTADNDYAFQTAATGSGLQTRRNNLAQRNLSVASMTARSLHFPFVIGHPANPERTIELVIDGGRAARDGTVQLARFS